MTRSLAPVSAALALVALVTFPLVVLALVAGAVVLAVLLVDDAPLASKVLGWVAVPLLVALVGAVVEAVRARPAPAEGPELHRADHPALWAELDAVAAAAGTSAPDRVVVDLDVNASVQEVGGRRELVLGLPLLAGLDRGQLRSVLAHELGHLVAGHTRTTRTTLAAHRAGTVLEAVMAEVSTPVRLVLLPFAALYAALSTAATREQELQADELSARVAGAETAVSALRRVVALDVAWEHYVEDYLVLSAPARRRPQVVAGFTALLLQDGQQLGEAVDAVLAQVRRGSLLDSHPPFARRAAYLRAAAVPEPAAGADDRAPALDLLGGGPSAAPRLEEQLVAGTIVPAADPVADWDELVDAAWRVGVEEDSAALVRAGERTGLARPGTPALLLEAVAQGHGLRLAAEAEPSARGEERREVLQELLVALAAQVLVDGGRVRAEVSWTGPWRVRSLDADGTPSRELDLDALVEPVLADPLAGTAALTRTLVALGGDLSTRVERPARALRPEVTGALVQLASGRRRVDALVALDGLLVVPSRRHPWWARLVGPVAARRSRDAARALLDADVDALVAGGARWVASEEVEAASLGIRPWGWTVTLDLVGGERLKVRTTQETEEAGDPDVGLGALLAAHPRRRRSAPDHRAGDSRPGDRRPADGPDPRRAEDASGDEVREPA